MKSALKKLILAFSCQLMASSWVWACPRCVDATPYKLGLQLAVVVLLPVPFVCAFLVYRFIRKAGQEETAEPSSQPAATLNPSLHPVQD